MTPYELMEAERPAILAAYDAAKASDDDEAIEVAAHNLNDLYRRMRDYLQAQRELVYGPSCPITIQK